MATTEEVPAVNLSAVRDMMAEMLTEIIDKTDADADTTDVIVTNCEKGIFNATIEACQRHGIRARWDVPWFERMYRSMGLRVLSNIDPDSYIHNAGLLPKLIAREIMPHELAFMAYPELFPEVWREPQERINIKLQKAFSVDMSRVTDQYKCMRCKQRKCTFYEMQTRSADEPMTRFITCQHCKKTWKE